MTYKKGMILRFMQLNHPYIPSARYRVVSIEGNLVRIKHRGKYFDFDAAYFEYHKEDQTLWGLFGHDQHPTVEEYETALKQCVDALYEAVEIAPLDRIPSKAASAIQQAQYLLGR